MCDGLLGRHINVTRSKLGKSYIFKTENAITLKPCTDVYF